MVPDPMVEKWQRDLAAMKLKIPALRKAIENEKDPKLKAGMQDQLLIIETRIGIVKMYEMGLWLEPKRRARKRVNAKLSRPKIIRDGWKRTRSRRPPGPVQPR